MRISPPLKVALVALPVGALLQSSAMGLARSLAFAAGAALFTFAWIMFTPRPPTVTVSAAEPAAAPECPEQRNGTVQDRISRTPTGRSARDVRCHTTRPTARARRSTRRH